MCVFAIHAWVRLYSTWLQYPAGLGMGSNTLTQLSDQTNWVWNYGCAHVCRRTFDLCALMTCGIPLCICRETYTCNAACLSSFTTLSPLYLLKYGLIKAVRTCIHHSICLCMLTSHHSLHNDCVCHMNTPIVLQCLTSSSVCLHELTNIPHGSKICQKCQSFLWKLLADDHVLLLLADPVLVLASPELKCWEI